MQAEMFIPTLGMSREKWLKARQKGIGGSDAAAIAGLNPWKSPITVYFEKLGEAPEIEDNERMRIGRDLEDYVAQRFTEATGFKVRRRNAILHHPKHDFMLANVDRLIVGRKEGLECKTTNSYAANDWEGDKIPPHYQLQCHHYMAVTGYKAWWIAVLIGNQEFLYKKIKRDEEIIKYLIQIESDFWKMVQDKTPPAMDGSNDADDLLSFLYPESVPEKEIHLDSLEDKLKTLERIKVDIKELDQQKKEIEQTIKNEMEDSEIALIGERKVTWKTTISNRIDSKKLKKEKPEIYEQYCKESISRRFLIK